MVEIIIWDDMVTMLGQNNMVGILRWDIMVGMIWC